MYLVDTNVISELRKRSATRNTQVTQWVRSVPIAELYLSAVSIYEIDVGIRAAALHVPDPRPLADSFIAATAIEHNLVVVTRNTKDFMDIGVGVLNPFTFES
jgi:hypothetical protein